MACDCFDAVKALHDFFAEWYRGDPVSFETLETALDERFRIVTPKGNVMDRDQTIAGVGAGRGSDPNAGIEVIDRGCTQVRGLHLTMYEEHHRFSDSETARLSTAVLEHRDGRWLWHHVHETWMEQ